MNGVHDMGGMHGFGAIRRDDAPFHAAWELRVRAMMAILLRDRVFNIDEFRRAVESIPPAEYLASGYFERWLNAVQELLREKGVLTVPGVARAREHPPLPAANAGTARFLVDDRVRASNQHHETHTRLPRYVRGKQGVVARVHGAYTFPDSNAHGLGPHPQPVYSVRFSARDLWGDAAAPNDIVHIDLWESYLEPT